MKERSAGNHLNERMIKTLCGASAYRKGEALFRAGKVELRRPEGAESGEYEAFVRDGDTLLVKLRPGSSDDAAAAECECSAGFAFERQQTPIEPAYCSLISTSTPAGRSSFIRASTVWAFGCTMSSKRL